MGYSDELVSDLQELCDDALSSHKMQERHLDRAELEKALDILFKLFAEEIPLVETTNLRSACAALLNVCA